MSHPAESRPEVAAGAQPIASGGDGAPTVYRAQDVTYHSPLSYPPHERCVEVRWAGREGMSLLVAATVGASARCHACV